MTKLNIKTINEGFAESESGKRVSALESYCQVHGFGEHKGETIQEYYATQISLMVEEKKKEILEKIDRMKNYNEMAEMEGMKYAQGFERAREDLRKIVEELLKQ